MKLLEVKNISKCYSGQEVLQSISLSMEEGEIVALLGASGVGKTTLFNIISGTIQPEKGSVYLEGEEITGETGHFSYMMQKDLLLPHLKILDNVSLALQIRGVDKKEARDKARQYLPAFHLAGTEDKYPGQLSGGMRQRAALLRTYLASGKVMLLDEPFSALDTLTKKEIYSWYLETSDKYGLSTFFITHDIDEAILLSDRVYILKGSPATITHEASIQTEDRQGFELDPKFLKYKKEVLEALV